MQQGCPACVGVCPRVSPVPQPRPRRNVSATSPLFQPLSQLDASFLVFLGVYCKFCE